MVAFPSVDDLLTLLAKKANQPAANGSNGQVLVRDSSKQEGVAWVDLTAGGGLTPLFPDSQTYGSSTKVPRITRDSFGRITAVEEVQIQYPSTSTGGGSGIANPMTATGDLIVGGAGGAVTRLPGVSAIAKRFLQASGTGSAPTTPVWGAIQVADVVGAADLQNSYVGINTQSGASYTASVGDVGKLVLMTNASANTFVLPTNAAAAIGIGKWIDIAQYGAGATSVGFSTGVQVRSPGNLLTIEKQYRVLRATKVGTNEWLLTGHFASANAGGGQTTDPGTGTTTPTTVTNKISSQAIQNASDASKFSAASGTVTVDSTISKSGGSSLKLAPDGTSGSYPYLNPVSPGDWAPVTAGKTYTGFVSVRLDANISAAFQCYIAWYDASNNQLGIANSNGQVTGVQGNFVQVSSTGVAPANATAAAVITEYGAAGAVLLAANTVHVDEYGINEGASTTWTSGSTQGGTTSPASVTDAGFTYAGTWLTATNPSEHYSSTVGDSASITFTLNGPSTFSLKGKQDSSNGTLSISVDNGTAITVSEQQATTQDNATIWTSGTLTAGTHTVKVTVASPDGSIQGASIGNGVFAAPAANTGGGGGTNTGGTGTGTSGSNTTVNGNIIGGAASSSNPSGYAPPSLDAFPGYTNILQQDFATNFAEGRANGSAVLGSGWFSYEGQQNGNYDGMYWDTDQISANGSVVTMRNTNKGSNCQALSVIYTDSQNVGKAHKQQAMAYGRTMIRMKARGSTGYKIAFLMWPTTDNWNDGEIDFPEGDTVSPDRSKYAYTMTSNTHNVTGNPIDGKYKDAANVSGLGTAKGTIDDGLWHTFTLEWDSNKIRFLMDGVVMDTVTDSAYIPKVPMRWVLQCEPTKGQESNAANYIDIDWVAAWKKG